MNLTTARAFVSSAVRDGSSESATNIDQAIQAACDRFCRLAKCVIKTDSVAITEDSTSFPLAVPLANGFRPERVLDAWITGEPDPLALIDYGTLNTLAANDDGTGVPTRLAFLDNTGNGLLWPTPNDDFTAKLRYWQPFGITVSSVFSTSWTPGTADADTLAGTLNIPDDVIKPVLYEGAAAILKGPSPEVAYASAAWARFLDYCREMAGSGNLGARTMQRGRASDQYRRAAYYPGSA